MSDIRKRKCLIGLAAVFVLLSFLYSAPVFAQLSAGIFPGYEAAGEAAKAEFAEASMIEAGGMPKLSAANEKEAVLSETAVMDGAEARALRPATISAGNDNLPGGTDSISLAKKAAEDILTREQKQSQTRTLLMRFLVVVFALVLAVCVSCRILIRRYGCHMIAVWQNITYIHQVDGKKGERFSVYIG